MLVKIHVTPNAKQASVTRTGEDALDVRVDERAVDGRANKRLLEILSEYYKIPKSSVTIVRGARSRDKIVNVALENPGKSDGSLSDRFSRVPVNK